MKPTFPNLKYLRGDILPGNKFVALMGLLTENFAYLKDVPCPLIIVFVSYVKKLITCYKKNRKMYFYQISGLTKRHYWMGIWLSKSLTEREFGSQNHLPDENLDIKYSDPK